MQVSLCQKVRPPYVSFRGGQSTSCSRHIWKTFFFHERPARGILNVCMSSANILFFPRCPIRLCMSCNIILVNDESPGSNNWCLASYDKLECSILPTTLMMSSMIKGFSMYMTLEDFTPVGHVCYFISHRCVS